MDNLHWSVLFLFLTKIAYDDLSFLSFFFFPFWSQKNSSLNWIRQYCAELLVPGMLPHTGDVQMPVHLNSEKMYLCYRSGSN